MNFKQYDTKLNILFKNTKVFAVFCMGCYYVIVIDNYSYSIIPILPRGLNNSSICNTRLLPYVRCRQSLS